MNDKLIQQIQERKKSSRNSRKNIYKRWQEDEKQEKLLREKQGKKPVTHAIKGKTVSYKEAERILEKSR